MRDKPPASHYAVLGLMPDASAADIKRAYRTHAKAAHPDAGGSVSAMAEVNEAYRTLSDPAARRKYDLQTRPAAAEARPERTSTAPEYEPASPDMHQPEPPHPAREHRHQHDEARRVQHERAAWARTSAWEMLRLSAPFAIGAIIVKHFLSGGLGFDFITFLPIYSLILSILFLINPALRLVFADLARRYPTTRHERLSALALVLAYFPLALGWSALT